jgi:hypothetical protein
VAEFFNALQTVHAFFSHLSITAAKLRHISLKIMDRGLTRLDLRHATTSIAITLSQRFIPDEFFAPHIARCVQQRRVFGSKNSGNNSRSRLFSAEIFLLRFLFLLLSIAFLH